MCHDGGGRPADRAKYTTNRSQEPLVYPERFSVAANLLICYLMNRLPSGGVQTEDICGCLPPPPFSETMNIRDVDMSKNRHLAPVLEWDRLMDGCVATV